MRIFLLLLSAWLLATEQARAEKICENLFSRETLENRQVNGNISIGTTYSGDNGWKFVDIEIQGAIGGNGVVHTVAIKNRKNASPLFSRNYIFTDLDPKFATQLYKTTMGEFLVVESKLQWVNGVLALEADGFRFKLFRRDPGQIHFTIEIIKSGMHLPDAWLNRRPLGIGM